jgi:hypothetical protein
MYGRKARIRRVLAVFGTACAVPAERRDLRSRRLLPLPELRVDRAAVVAALEYWRSAAGIEFTP